MHKLSCVLLVVVACVVAVTTVTADHNEARTTVDAHVVSILYNETQNDGDQRSADVQLLHSPYPRARVVISHQDANDTDNDGDDDDDDDNNNSTSHHVFGLSLQFINIVQFIDNGTSAGQLDNTDGIVRIYSLNGTDSDWSNNTVADIFQGEESFSVFLATRAFDSGLGLSWGGLLSPTLNGTNATTEVDVAGLQFQLANLLDIQDAEGCLFGVGLRVSLYLRNQTEGNQTDIDDQVELLHEFLDDELAAARNLTDFVYGSVIGGNQTSGATVVPGKMAWTDEPPASVGLSDDAVPDLETDWTDYRKATSTYLFLTFNTNDDRLAFIRWNPLRMMHDDDEDGDDHQDSDDDEWSSSSSTGSA